MVASVRPAWLLVTLLTLASSCAGAENGTVRVLGLRLPAVDSKNAYDEAGVITVQEGIDTTIEVLGLGLTPDTKIRLTSDEMAEVRLANLLGLQPRRGIPEEAQKYGRGDVVQDPRIRREGGGGGLRVRKGRRDE